MCKLLRLTFHIQDRPVELLFDTDATYNLVQNAAPIQSPEMPAQFRTAGAAPPTTTVLNPSTFVLAPCETSPTNFFAKNGPRETAFLGYCYVTA